MGLVDLEFVHRALQDLHGSAVYWSEESLWIDCSNKLTWIIQPLIEVFPDALFINLVRDGRKVANSFIRKLGDEMYDDKSVAVLTEWLENKETHPMPPPEKRYWWNIPRGTMPMAAKFPEFDQFQRAVYHWVEANRVASQSLSQFVSQEQYITIRLEDLVASKQTLQELCEFVDLELDDSYWTALQRPENVIYPMDAKLTAKQQEQFAALAEKTMVELGYDLSEPEYSVDYK